MLVGEMREWATLHHNMVVRTRVLALCDAVESLQMALSVARIVEQRLKTTTTAGSVWVVLLTDHAADYRTVVLGVTDTEDRAAEMAKAVRATLVPTYTVDMQGESYVERADFSIVWDEFSVRAGAGPAGVEELEP